MTIQYLLGNTIISKASNALILSLSTMEELSAKERKEKIELIYMRNRILQALEKSHCPVIHAQSVAIQSFFSEIGGEKEGMIAPLSSFNLVQKTIENSIVSSIIFSLKADDTCSEAELKEKESQQKLRNEIIQHAKKHASPAVFARMEIFFATLEQPLNLNLG